MTHYTDLDGIERIAEYFGEGRGISPVGYLEIRSLEGKVLMRRVMADYEAAHFIEQVSA